MKLKSPYQTFSILILAFVFLALEAAVAAAPRGSVYLSGKSSEVGVILAHGRGKHPRWLVVDPLRKAFQQELGYHTLSLQLPGQGIPKEDWKDTAELFPQAYEIFRAGIRFFRDEKKIKKIFIVGHSMGGRMASAFVSQTRSDGVVGLSVIGCRNNGGYPLDCDGNLSQIRSLPILDIFGTGSEKDAIAGEDRTYLRSRTYVQKIIRGAGHKFESRGEITALASQIIKWMKSVATGKQLADKDPNEGKQDPVEADRQFADASHVKRVATKEVNGDDYESGLDYRHAGDQGFDGRDQYKANHDGAHQDEFNDENHLNFGDDGGSFFFLFFR